MLIDKLRNGRSKSAANEAALNDYFKNGQKFYCKGLKGGVFLKLSSKGMESHDKSYCMTMKPNALSER
jgi:hypothetical protein